MESDWRIAETHLVLFGTEALEITPCHLVHGIYSSIQPLVRKTTTKAEIGREQRIEGSSQRIPVSPRFAAVS